jgi:IS1 family transposase/transposase-like protein
MIVAACQHNETRPHGKDSKGQARRRCVLCGKTFVQKPATAYGNLRITDKEAATILGMLLEGMAIRSVERLTGTHRDTICDLLLRVGEKCERFMASAIRDVQVDDVQCDEIWSFVAMKDKQRTALGHSQDCGDSWTAIAIERNTKLVLAYEVGQRDGYTIRSFLRKLNNATTGRFQLSTDGLKTYTNNVPFTFGSRLDFGQLIKSFSQMQSTIRYSPATIIASEKKAIFGNPDHDRICTSHIESFNQKFRMALRRFTRLTNAHSKSLDHHAAMQAIYFCYYNFCRKHETIKTTPAMAAGIADKQWTIIELLGKISA